MKIPPCHYSQRADKPLHVCMLTRTPLAGSPNTEEQQCPTKTEGKVDNVVVYEEGAADASL